MSEAIRSGADSNNIIGNNNRIGDTLLYIPNPNNRMKRSVLYDVCCTLSKAEMNDREEYALHTNSDWLEKIEYNDIDEYKDVFEMYSFYYGVVEEVLKQIPKREVLIRNIKTIYRKNKRIHFNCTKDEILDAVFNELSEIVVQSDQFSDEGLLEEEKCEAIYLIMFYAFTKCQLLDVVPRRND